jgi:exosortase K
VNDTRRNSGERGAPWTWSPPGRLLPVAITVALALAIAGLLKLHYHRATFDDLAWVLTPTARVVEVLSGTAFELEPHRGYLSRAHHFEIVPACAGVNFMIVAFLSVVLGLVSTARSMRAHAFLLAAGLVAAYGTTVAANAARITIAMRMHDAALAIGPFTPDRLHRIEGVAVYFAFLCALFLATQCWAGGDRALAR